jgi:glycosyltransferase involved in cell wall biosynthesis
VTRRQPRVVHVSTVHTWSDHRIFHKECKTLASRYDVHLIAPDAPDGQRIDGVTLHAGRRFIRRPARMLFGPWFAFAQAIRLNADVIHVHDPEMFPFIVLARLLRRIAIVDIHEHFRDDIRRKPYLHPKVARLLSETYRAVETVVLRTASTVIAATPTLAAGYGGRAIPVCNYASLADWDSVGHQPYAERPLNVVYVGLLAEKRAVRTMVDAARLLEVSHPSAQTLFLGPIHGGLTVDSMLPAKYLGKTDVTGVKAILEFARVGLVLSQPSHNASFGLATKVFEYFAASIPVVISASFELMAEMAQTEGWGLVVPHDNATAVADAVASLLDDPVKAAKMGACGRAVFESKYNWEGQRDNLLQAYEEVLA